MSEDINTSVESSDPQKPTSEPPSSSSERPISRTKHFIERANAMKGIILAISAFVASIASFFKPQDISATKNSYEHTAKQIETISAVSVQNHDDIVALRAYLEGYVRAQKSEIKSEGTGLGSIKTPSPGPSPMSGQGFGTGSGRLGGSRRSPSPPVAAPAQAPSEPPKVVQNYMEAQKEPLPPPSEALVLPEPPLPPVSPRPKAIKSESFDSMIQ